MITAAIFPGRPKDSLMLYTYLVQEKFNAVSLISLYTLLHRFSCWLPSARLRGTSAMVVWGRNIIRHLLCLASHSRPMKGYSELVFLLSERFQLY